MLLVLELAGRRDGALEDLLDALAPGRRAAAGVSVLVLGASLGSLGHCRDVRVGIHLA